MTETPNPVAAMRAARAQSGFHVRCPWCGAQPDQWCERKPYGARPMGFLHPSRIDASKPGGAA